MDEVRLGDQTIRYDRGRTLEAYAAMKGRAAERCGCLFCRNFLAQWSTVYPQSFLTLLDQLGIDLEKEGEVYEGAPDGLLWIYGGWFYLAGELIEPGERLTDAGMGLQFFFRASRNPKTSVADFGSSVLALEFSTKLPWVVPDRP